LVIRRQIRGWSRNLDKNPFTTEKTHHYRGVVIGKKVALLLVLVFLTASTTVAINSVSAPTVNEDSWTIRKSMPTARSGLGVAVINDKIYAIGGVGKLPSFDTNEEYEPVADAWITRESMLTPRGEFAIAVF
jgi:hypothetical protein